MSHVAHLQVFRAGPKKKEFAFRMIVGPKEITRSSEAYERKATMLRVARKYHPRMPVVDLTTKKMEASFAGKGPKKKWSKKVFGGKKK